MAKWIVPPLLGVAVGWATGATADAPPPVAWTIAGIGNWLSVPFHWAFVIIGAVSGISAFIGLQQFIHPSEPAPAPLPPEFGELTEEIKALRLQLLAQNPAGAQQIEIFASTATDLAGSDSAEDRSIAREAVEGDPLAASDRLMAEVETGVAEQAERARQAARIAAPFSVAKAITAYARAVDLDPMDFWTWTELSRLHQVAGSLPLARRTAEAALQHVGDDRDRSVAETELGQIAVIEGNLDIARNHFHAAHNADKALAAADPGNAAWQRDLSISHNKLGDVAREEGDLAGARTGYTASLAIRERLAAADPGNAAWQRDLSISHERLGDVAEAQGDYAEAVRCYEASLQIARMLAETRPDHPGFVRDLAITERRLDGLRARLRGV